MQPRYFFGGQVQSLAGLLQPEQTLLFIGRPHFLHGEHPHAWHMRHLVKIVIVWLSYYPFQSGAGQAEIATRLPVLAWVLQKGLLVLVKRVFLKNLQDKNKEV
jgi:hypothetical protein